MSSALINCDARRRMNNGWEEDQKSDSRQFGARYSSLKMVRYSWQLFGSILDRFNASRYIVLVILLAALSACSLPSMSECAWQWSNFILIGDRLGWIKSVISLNSGTHSVILSHLISSIERELNSLPLSIRIVLWLGRVRARFRFVIKEWLSKVILESGQCFTCPWKWSV